MWYSLILPDLPRWKCLKSPVNTLTHIVEKILHGHVYSAVHSAFNNNFFHDSSNISKPTVSSRSFNYILSHVLPFRFVGWPFTVWLKITIDYVLIFCSSRVLATSWRAPGSQLRCSRACLGSVANTGDTGAWSGAVRRFICVATTASLAVSACECLF